MRTSKTNFKTVDQDQIVRHIPGKKAAVITLKNYSVISSVNIYSHPHIISSLSSTIQLPNFNRRRYYFYKTIPDGPITCLQVFGRSKMPIRTVQNENVKL